MLLLRVIRRVCWRHALRGKRLLVHLWCKAHESYLEFNLSIIFLNSETPLNLLEYLVCKSDIVECLSYHPFSLTLEPIPLIITSEMNRYSNDRFIIDLLHTDFTLILELLLEELLAVGGCHI